MPARGCESCEVLTWYVSEKLEKSLLALINSFGSLLSRTFDSVQCCKAMFTLLSPKLENIKNLLVFLNSIEALKMYGKFYFLKCVIFLT